MWCWVVCTLLLVPLKRHYDTRHVVFEPKLMDRKTLLDGYHRAYQNFYSWRNIACASLQHKSVKHRVKHLAYSAGWRKFEPLWDTVIRARQLRVMTPLLEGVLSKVTAPIKRKPESKDSSPQAGSPQPIKFFPR